MIQAKPSLKKAVSIVISEKVGWTPLPSWAQFFIELGWGLGELDDRGDRLIVGLSVPTRAYAAAFAALGAVLSRAEIPVTVMTADEHFMQFAGLPRGTPVTLIEGNRKMKGLMVGCEESYGALKVGVQVENKAGGGLTYWLPAKESHRISARVDGETKLPKKKTRRRIVPMHAFLKHLLDCESPWQFASTSRLDCVLLGSITALRQEISETVFGLPVGRQIEAGTLNDVLRVRRFQATSDDYRSDVLHIHGKNLPRTGGNGLPHIAIFDGSASFLKWRDRFRQSNWLVIISMTEARAVEAVDVLNSEYILQRTADSLIDHPKAPPGIELVRFWERRA